MSNHNKSFITLNSFKNKKLIVILFLIFCVFYCSYLTIRINQKYIYPTESEIESMMDAYGNLTIKDEKSIIKIQNIVIETCKHEYNNYKKQIIVDKVLIKGLCYDRSLILQKIMIYNGFPVRPVYLYTNGIFNCPIDLFIVKNLQSHSIFEVKINSQWFVVETNQKMKKLETLNTRLEKDNFGFKTKLNYIRYLSNRNGRFVAPSFIPDIYYFN